MNKAPDGGDAKSRLFPRHASSGWGIGLQNEGRGLLMGRHFTFGEASPPLGAFDERFRWFPALKRRAGLTSPPLGAFANEDQCDRHEGIRPQTCSLPTTLGMRMWSRSQRCGQRAEQRPGLIFTRRQSPDRATESPVVWPPCQGSLIHRSTFPRALPWAVLDRPVGALTIMQNQTSGPPP